jgi:hypothetical protein
MRKTTWRMVPLIAASAMLAGCLHQSVFEKTVLSRIQPGMSREEAISRLEKLELACRPMRATDNSNAWTACTRQKPRLLDGCIQRVNFKTTQEDKVSKIEIPDPACAGL